MYLPAVGNVYKTVHIQRANSRELEPPQQWHVLPPAHPSPLDLAEKPHHHTADQGRATDAERRDVLERRRRR